ncbi:hypothetical protein [Clostridium sp. DMHC 10]|uniref:hypothetical protein n=1 Tax=Clostridium sp. DMHC 10 TaxID=747377 RepID=UPI000AC11042|nr:hypothetical protein [Clostridium sp. DMHC 10]
MENKKENFFHNLKIINEEIKLDDFQLKGVEGYKIESPAKGVTELTIKIAVNSNVAFN